MIRKMRKTDIDRVAQIWLDTNLQAHGFIPAEYWEDHFPEVREMLCKAELYVYEGEDDKPDCKQERSKENDILGFIGLNEEYIEGIFVCGRAQSHGIGRALLDYAKERKPKLALNVYKKNRRAVNFYQREHFCMKEEGRDESTGEREYRMVWERN